MKRVAVLMAALLIASCAMLASTEAASAAPAGNAKKAVKAYKSYLAKHKSVKYFKVVKLGNGGIPVLLCTPWNKMQTGEGSGFTEVDVIVYKKSDKGKVRNIGSISTGGSTYALHYANKKLFGQRVADIHTLTKVTVKNGKLSMTGMYDGSYGDWLLYRHFSDYCPADGVCLAESAALGEWGTQAEYQALSKEYGKAKKLTMYKNTKKNRSKHVK